MRLISFILLAFICSFFACKSETKTDEAGSSTQTAETPQATEDPLLAELEVATFPLSYQTLPETKNKKELSDAFINKFMRDTASRDGENALSYNLIAYHKIKKYGKTDEEREASGKFYLGEPIKVNYYPHKLLKKDANMVLFTVICTSQTTQACPYFTGTEVYLIATKPSGEAISAVVIAEDSEASDPPMSSEYTAKCDVKNLTEPINVKIVSNVAEDDPDKPVKTVSTKKVTIGSDGKLSVAEK